MLGELWMFSAQIHSPGPQTLLHIWNKGGSHTDTNDNHKHTKNTTTPMNHQEVRHSQSLSTTGEKEGKENQDTHTTHQENTDPTPPTHTLSYLGLQKLFSMPSELWTCAELRHCLGLQTQLYTCNDQIKVTWRHGHDLVLDDFHAD